MEKSGEIEDGIHFHTDKKNIAPQSSRDIAVNHIKIFISTMIAISRCLCNVLSSISHMKHVPIQMIWRYIMNGGG